MSAKPAFKTRKTRRVVIMGAGMSIGLLKNLDNSQFTSEHGRIYSIALLGHFCDGFDINVMGFVLPAIIGAFHLTGASAGFLASAVFFGMFLGAAGGGLMADKVGRKKTVIVSMLVYAGASLAAAIAPTYWALWGARLIEGIGLGAEVVLIFSYVVEFVPVKTRGTLTSSTVFFWQISSFVAAAMAISVIPNYGWRMMFILGGAFSLIGAIAWLTLPESVRFLLQKGRVDEANKVIQKFGARLPKDVIREEIPQKKMRLSDLLGRDYRMPTLSVWSLQFLDGFVFFGIAVWLPTLLLHMGYSFVHSFLFTGIITGSGAIGNVVGGLLLDRWGRRPTLILYFILGGVALALWGFSTSAAAVVIIGATGAFFSFGAAGPLFTYVSEIYPTELRATGVGFSGSWQRVGGVAAPFVLGVLVGAKVGITFIFGFVGALMLLGGVIACFTVFETRLESLEQIQSDVVAGA